jgi:adenylate cyclase
VDLRRQRLGEADLPLIVSDDFARAYGGTLQSLGLHQLRGLDLPHELFTPLAV